MTPQHVWVLHHPYEFGTWRGLEKCAHDEAGSLRAFLDEDEALRHHKQRQMPAYMVPWRLDLIVPSVGALPEESSDV